ncbi:hypothetical protein BBI17_002381 [Phytophthora kernoviae]|uniref:CCT domain-containing protein n=3 Tax=Phytophthora kernoviae TaxID=325452 RepID=A0A3R7JCG5_9STRA|nr:hypothetical protein BBI17_002381 [Phytophthora kernoviae]
MLISRKRSREINVMESTLPVLRRPGDNCWMLNNTHNRENKAEPTPSETYSDAASDGYMTPSSEDLEAEYENQAKTQRKTVDEVSPTSVHNLPRDLTPLRLDYITEPAKMIGVYSPAARRALLQKYMAKRARRLSQHKVRYGVRKTLANARPRVKGRFVKTVQPLTAAAVEAQRTEQI